MTCDLLVLADGRLSRNAERVGASAYRVVESPWFALLAYYENLPLPTDRSYFSLQDRQRAHLDRPAATSSGASRWICTRA